MKVTSLFPTLHPKQTGARSLPGRCAPHWQGQRCADRMACNRVSFALGLAGSGESIRNHENPISVRRSPAPPSPRDSFCSFSECIGSSRRQSYPPGAHSTPVCAHGACCTGVPVAKGVLKVLTRLFSHESIVSFEEMICIIVGVTSSGARLDLVALLPAIRLAKIWARVPSLVRSGTERP